MAIKNKYKDTDRPDFLSLAYQKMLEGWTIAADLWGGTLEIRAKGKVYLPQFPREPAEQYRQRLASAVFYNVFQRTVSGFVGMVFKNNIVPEDAPEAIKEMFPDIDLCGNDIEMFLRETFTNAVRDGHSFIFVDAPPPLETESKPTLADVSGRRPYWINYKASQALNWQYVIEHGKLVLTRITFETVTNEPDGKFGEKSVVRYKTLRRGENGATGTYEEYTINDKGEPVPEGERAASWTNIPLCVVYGRKMSPMESTPPLMELANLNILHYQKTSDFDDICHRICVPILKRRLDSKEALKELIEIEKGITISPAVMMNVFGEHADVEYVEVTGAGLSIASGRIKEIEAQMSKLGLELLAPNDSLAPKTATEVRSDNTNAQSDLAVMARNLETAVEQAFYFTAEMTNAIKGANTINLNETEKSKMRLKLDYDRLSFSVQQLQFFNELVDGGKLSIETFLEWLPQITDMPKNFTPEEELKRLKKEKPLRDAKEKGLPISE